jgi:hypothetical protein
MAFPMIWIIWAFMLLTHGALASWAKTARNYAKISVITDVLLIAIGLMTLDQLQGMGIADIARIGLFFVAFGAAGRQLMSTVLKRSAAT